MEQGEGKYNIKAVSKQLGVQPGTIRAWERRYDMISPIRNEAGHRLYSQQQVEQLRWLVHKINQGFTISQAIQVWQQSDRHANQIKTESVQHDMTSELLQALLSFEEKKAHDSLDRAFSLYSFDLVITDLLIPLLNSIGHQWATGQITTAHEHFATSFLRSRIGHIFHTMPVKGFLPKAVSVCSPGETHELGLLIFTLFLRRKGFEVIYLGTGIAEEDMDIVINEIQPRLLVMSCTFDRHLPALRRTIQRILKQEQSLDLALGGSAVSADDALFSPYTIGDRAEEWEDWMHKYFRRRMSFD
ncbi:MerR family transcriptional regulator [Aureibacillus halotolerans]|uniref:Methanogenic corrinoid protein MtbC1 n=1 Tax=Aureibacillus halotolerans TaxID=1508390 RepID=A0A4V3D5V5_9BACI|nr:MerR family transcriptional regulator [Aureibacillus halotolerans]TDQ41557.1 methanogenic corrinoid protein MtbC1 [Aureibacillus halotolerans]